MRQTHYMGELNLCRDFITSCELITSSYLCDLESLNTFEISMKCIESSLLRQRTLQQSNVMPSSRSMYDFIVNALTPCLKKRIPIKYSSLFSKYLSNSDLTINREHYTSRGT